MELYEQPIHKLHQQLKNRQISARELTTAFLNRIDATNEKINTFITVTRDQAMQDAEAADKMIATGNCLPLTGIPIALKDMLMVDGQRTTCGSRMLSDFVAPYDATVWTRLKTQGAVLLGKLNMDEFSMGSSTETSFFGPVRNPWNLDCVPGGSSGGSAAAIVAGQAAATIGSDSGGSIRQPAAVTGCVGLKPSYGRVSRYGAVAYASSMDQPGPLTSNVTDAAIMLSAIAGHDPCDGTSLDTPVPDYESALQQDIRGLKLGLPKEYFDNNLDPEIRQALEQAKEVYCSLGAELVEVSLPHSKYSFACYYLISNAEASSNFGCYTGVTFGHRAADTTGLADLILKSRTEGFGSEVKRRILAGTYFLTERQFEARYIKAQRVRTLIRQDFDKVFSEVDILLTPATRSTAFKLGERITDPMQMYQSDMFTIPGNLSGGCGISVPAGFSSSGLPIGLQLLGRPFDEATILKAAYAYEQATNWHLRRAAI